MAIKLKHAGTISGGSGRGKSGPQMSDASRVDTSGHIITAPAVVGKTSAHPGAGGGGGGHAPLVSAPHGASMISAPPVSGGSARVGGGRGGVRVGGKGKGLPGSSSSSSALGGRGGIKSIRSTTGYGPQVPPPDFEVTGYDPRVRPDRHSVWNPQTAQWERGKVAYQNWLGGMGDERRGNLAAEADERKFTEAQRREAEQLNAVYERARKSGRYTPEELDQIGAQIEARKAGIQPLSQLPQPSAQDQFNESIVTDPQTGNRYRRDAKGNYVPMEGGGVTPDMWNKWYEYESKVKVTNENGVVRERTPEEVSAAMKAREAEFMSRFGPQQPTEESGVTDVTNSPRGTGTITAADGRTVSTGDLPGRGSIVITQNGKSTAMSIEEITRNPAMVENLKEHWAAGAGMNPNAKPSPSTTDASAAGEQKPRRGLLLLDQGQLPDYAKNRSGGEDSVPVEARPVTEPTPEAAASDSPGSPSGGEESAPPPKKEKKDDE